MMTISRWLCITALLMQMGVSNATEGSVAERLVSLKGQALSTQRDLDLLKRELTHSQDRLLVYLKVDIDTRFELLEAKLSVNGHIVKQHHYTTADVTALRKGGNHPLATLPLAQGEHQLQVYIKAKNQNNLIFEQRDSISLTKSNTSKIVSIRLLDNLSAQQYRFGINEWND